METKTWISLDRYLEMASVFMQFVEAWEKAADKYYKGEKRYGKV